MKSPKYYVEVAKTGFAELEEIFETCQNEVIREYEEKLRWIPVEERHPKENVIVEVRNDNCTPRFSHASKTNGRWRNPYYSSAETYPEPTHWRYIL